MDNAKLAVKTKVTGTSDLAQATQNRFAQLRKLFEPTPLKAQFGMTIGEQTKYATWDCSKMKRPIQLLHMTDIQFGHVMCNEKRVIEYRDWVLSDPDRFVLFGGDNVDAGHKLSVGSPFEQICDPQNQVYRFCELMAPMRHRILGYVGGNHERRGNLTFGDLGSLIAYMLEIPYSAGRQFLDFNFGRGESFRVDLFHGRGAAQTAGAKMMMLHKFMQTGDSQIYLVGHLHDAMCKFDWRMIRQPGQNKVKLVKIGGAMSSSFLEYFGSYAEVAGMTPSGLMMARVIVEPDGKWELTLR
jgi:hypothetical protein